MMVKHGPRGYTNMMGNFLDSWAEREQRRIERRQAQPPRPGPFPRFFRMLERGFGTLAFALRCLSLVIYVIFIIAVVATHTVQGFVLAVGLVALLGLALYNTNRMVQQRRENGQNWFTGRTRESRAEVVARFDSDS
jgi:Flp pilus assembly protein TadB